MLTREAELAAWEEAGPLIRMLASHGVKMRAHPETFGMLWNPKFSTMPAEWQEDIRTHGIALVRCLWPRDDKGMVQPQRPGWTTGTATACCSCGGNCALYDPLGQPRHDRCGWMGQPPRLTSLGATGKALRLRQQGSQRASR